MGTTTDIGNRGEDAAAGWLMTNGFEILHRNWRNGRYELDIVARKGDTLHFVEVKCRKRNPLTAPQDAITPSKFRSLSRAAEFYVATYSIDLEIAFDLVAVEYDDRTTDVLYVPDAMVPRW